MAKKRPDTAVDQVVMLLSTDWFTPYWHVVGISPPEKQIKCFQSGCREIVTQMVDGASDYYQINFSEKRIERTRIDARKLATKCIVHQASSFNLGELIGSNPRREELNRTAWLFQSLIDMLVGDTKLDAEIRRILENSRHGPTLVDSGELASACLRADSVWDKFVRGLTPELPTSLSDFVSTDLAANALLNHILKQLTQSQKKTLFSRFIAGAKSVSGVAVDVTWPASDFPGNT
jgi:hypothetical protein